MSRAITNFTSSSYSSDPSSSTDELGSIDPADASSDPEMARLALLKLKADLDPTQNTPVGKNGLTSNQEAYASELAKSDPKAASSYRFSTLLRNTETLVSRDLNQIGFQSATEPPVKLQPPDASTQIPSTLGSFPGKSFLTNIKS